MSEGKTTTYEYYDNGTKKDVQYQDSSREDYTYFKNNLLMTLTNKKADGTILESYSYTYDKLNRLESVTEPSTAVASYTYDAAGNRLSESKTLNSVTTTTAYSYNDQNRLTATNTTGG